MSKSVSDELVGMLAAEGVRRLYGIVGDSLNPVMDALQQDDRIRWVHVRHEETAAFAASAEAQLTGRVAACCGSCGPGNLHLVNGLYDAHRSRAAVLALASHIPVSAIGSDYFQETHPTTLFAECCQYCELISSSAHARPIIARALRTARTRQDVGMVVLPGDVAAAHAAEGDEPASIPAEISLPGRVEPAAQQVEELARLINNSKSVAFLCGIGCAGAEQDIVKLAQRVAAPVAYTLRAKDLLEKDNPNAVGMTGLLGWGDATNALQEAELLILWGTDFPYTAFLPAHGRVVQVDTDAAVLGRRIPLQLALHGEVQRTASHLLPLIQKDRSDDFLARSLSRHGKAVTQLQAYVREVDEEAPLRPEYVTKLISDHAEPDAIFTVDTGTPVIWAARYLQALGKRRIIGSFKHGSMACALAMAIGVKATYPSRQVIALCGDGGLSMLPGDLLTLIQEKLSVKVFVYNNDALDFVAMEQQAIGMRPTGTGLQPASFASIAQSMGLKGIRLERPAEASAAVRQWLSVQEPALLDAKVDSHALALPPDISMLQALGFAKSLAKNVWHGELDTVRRILFGNRKLLF